MKRCPREECGVYAPGRFDFLFVAPRSLLGHVVGDDYEPRFRITPTDHDLSELHDRPDESYDTELALSEVAEDDPWAFLEPFAAREPAQGSNEQEPPRAQGRRA
jgi:hypothetical protein